MACPAVAAQLLDLNRACMIPDQKTDAFALAFIDVKLWCAVCSVFRTWSRSDDVITILSR